VDIWILKDDPGQNSPPRSTSIYWLPGWYWSLNLFWVNWTRSEVFSVESQYPRSAWLKHVRIPLEIIFCKTLSTYGLSKKIANLPDSFGDLKPRFCLMLLAKWELLRVSDYYNVIIVTKIFFVLLLRIINKSPRISLQRSRYQSPRQLDQRNIYFCPRMSWN
jgi:hypothetical protein